MSEGVNEGELNGFTPEEATQPRVVVLISGGGTNLQALIDAQSHDELGGVIVAVVSNVADAYGLKQTTGERREAQDQR